MTANGTTRAATALAEAIGDQGARLLDAWPAAVAGDAEALRAVRIATRRLRAALPLAAGATGDRDARRVRRDLRRVGRALGPSRELLVSRADLTRAAREHAWTAHDVAGIERWLDRRLLRTDRDRRRTLRHADITAVSARLATVLLATTSAEPSVSWTKLVGDMLARRAASVARARDACGTLYEPALLHDLRIAVKKLRYTVELVDVVTDVQCAALAATLKRAQQRYGELHDRQILLAEVRACAASGKSRTAPPYAGLVDDLEADCRRWHGDAMTSIADVDDGVAGATWLARVLLTSRLALVRARLTPGSDRRRRTG